MRYLRTRSGNVVAFGTTGSGPPLVVLLGWVSSLDVIASGRDPRSSVLERLSGRLSLTLYDRAGTGLSPGPVENYGIEAGVDEVTEVVRAVGPPVSLLAMSAAGPIAVALASRRPAWVSSLVLFGTFADATATFSDKGLRDMVVDIARNHWGMGSKLLADLYRPGSSDQATWHLARVFRDSATPEVAAEYLSATYDQDVFVNAVGGVKITEPAADLAVLLAILSSLNNRPLPRGLVVFGEIGLAGEIRPAPRGQERLREAAKLGFSIALIPKSNAPRQSIEGLEIWAVDRVEDAVDRLRNL